MTFFSTQYNKEIPNDEIDMDFMNLNQAAHGDREHGFIAARLRMPRKVIAGYWKNENVLAKIGSWMKAAVGVAVSKNMKVMRFGDNMREVAVTEGDKVEVQTKLGWQVNTWAVGDLVKEMNAVSDAEIDALMAEYTTNYDINTPNIEAIRYQAREEIAMKKMLDANGFKVEIYKPFADDLHGSSNLPADRLTLYMANNEQASNQTVVRINWCPKHALDMPRFINEEVSVFVSLASPYNLQDVPMIRTYVNAYTATRTTIRLAIEKLMGKSEFKGVSPVDAFCGLPDTNL